MLKYEGNDKLEKRIFGFRPDNFFYLMELQKKKKQHKEKRSKYQMVSQAPNPKPNAIILLKGLIQVS